jgi:hypothetical protein
MLISQKLSLNSKVKERKLPDFPKVSGVTAADVWGYATRTLTHITGDPRTDLIGANESLDTHGYTSTRAGYLENLDAAISTRGTDAGAATAVWGAAARTITAFTGQPRTDLLGENAAFSAATGARIANLDRMANVPAFVAVTEVSVLQDGKEQTLVEKSDGLQGLLEGDIDLTPMQSGDTVVVKQYMKVKSGGAYVLYAQETYTDAQSLPLLHISTKSNKRSIKVTIQQTAGTNRTFDAQFQFQAQASAT